MDQLPLYILKQVQQNYMSEENPEKKNISTYHSTPKTAINLSQLEQKSMHFLSHENKMYSKSCKAKKAVAKYFDEVHRENLQNNIKKSILDKLDRQSKEKQFQTKFNNAIQTKSFTSRKINTNTSIQRQENQRQLFFSNYSDVIKLQFQCRLRQFHFATIQKTKSKTQYLKKLPMTSRHRRVSSNHRQISKLFEQHSQKINRVNKNLGYIKHDKFIQKCSEMGKNSVSFRRQRNFQVIQYVIKEGHKKLLQCRQQSIFSEQEQKKFNKIMRLYLQFADYSEAYRIFYEYVSESSWQKLKTTICAACPKIKQKAIEQQVNDLLRYKTNKFLYFQDFNQLLQNLQQKHNCKIIEQIQEKYPNMLNLNELNQYIQKLGSQVRKWINKNKIDVAIKIMFHSIPAKLNMGKYLNIKTINEIFKKYELVPKIFWQNKLLFYCMWLKKRRQGLTYQELIQVIVHIILSRNGKPQAFYTGLKQLNLGSKLLK